MIALVQHCRATSHRFGSGPGSIVLHSNVGRDPPTSILLLCGAARRSSLWMERKKKLLLLWLHFENRFHVQRSSQWRWAYRIDVVIAHCCYERLGHAARKRVICYLRRAVACCGGVYQVSRRSVLGQTALGRWFCARISVLDVTY